MSGMSHVMGIGYNWMLQRASHVKPLASQKLVEDGHTWAKKRTVAWALEPGQAKSLAAIQMISLPMVNDQNEAGLLQTTGNNSSVPYITILLLFTQSLIYSLPAARASTHSIYVNSIWKSTMNR